jgi:hypothetical protein
MIRSRRAVVNPGARRPGREVGRDEDMVDAAFTR